MSQENLFEVNVKRVDRLSPTRVKLVLEYSNEHFKNIEQRTLGAYARSAKIPGFRPGKAPAHIIKDKYKGDILKDTLSKMLEVGVIEGIKKTQLFPLNEPKLQFREVAPDFGKPFEFEAEFEVRPEIEVKKYKNIPLKENKINVTEEEVSKVVERLQEQLATFEATDIKKPENGLIGYVEIGMVGIDTPINEAKRPFTIEFGKQELFESLEQAFKEMEVGQSKEIELAFPSDYNTAELQNKKAKFELSLHEIKKKVFPELNDAFANQVEAGKTMESLKAGITKQIEDSKKQAQKDQVRQSLMEFLVTEHPFEVPQSLVQREIQGALRRYQEESEKRKQPVKPISPEDMDVLQKNCEKVVRGSLLLSEIVKKEKLQVDENLLNERIQQIATMLKRDEKETKEWLEKQNILEKIKDEVLTDQVYDFLWQNADKEVVEA